MYTVHRNFCTCLFTANTIWVYIIRNETNKHTYISFHVHLHALRLHGRLKREIEHASISETGAGGFAGVCVARRCILNILECFRNVTFNLYLADFVKQKDQLQCVLFWNVAAQLSPIHRRRLICRNEIRLTDSCQWQGNVNEKHLTKLLDTGANATTLSA